MPPGTYCQCHLLLHIDPATRAVTRATVANESTITTRADERIARYLVGWGTSYGEARAKLFKQLEDPAHAWILPLLPETT